MDLSDPTMSCLLEDIPYRSSSAGGLLGTTPVICGGAKYDGGWIYFNECLLHGTSQLITMNSKRRHHSSVALNSSMLMLLGGRDGNNYLASTELITIDGTVNGPTLPEAVRGSCTVKFPDNGLVYLIGGNTASGYTNNVWVANPSNEFTFTPGPSLITARSYFGCGTMSIGTKSIIVAAGGLPGPLSSVEILDPLSNQWVVGK